MSTKKFETSSGEPVKDLYTHQDWSPNEQNLKKQGQPGESPFTRGIYPNMYRGKPWTMRQYAGFGSAHESNKRYRLLLSKGQTGLSVAFDLPTQMGYDSDHVMSAGEVGKVGVAISSIEDMEILLNEIPLDKVSTSMTINSTAGILLALYVAVARRRGISGEKLQGTVQNDLLKEYIARGTYIFPPKPSLRVITDIFDYCRTDVPNWNSISISGYHIREAGSTAAQELAFTIANGMTYVQAALNKGLDVDSFAPRLSFFFNVHNNFFEEVAKFRAARRMWADIMKNEFGAKNPNSLRLRFHSQTAGVTLTAQQPENNIVRVSMQALAAVLGGTQSLHTNSMDEALGLPTEKAATIALRTQQIIASETGVVDTVDPLAGSYFVESLTDQTEKQARDYLKSIKDRGGMIKCIETGWVQKEIQNAAYKYQIDMDKLEKVIVGVNAYQSEDLPFDTLKIDPKIEKDQVKRLIAFKKKRDAKKIASHLSKIENAAKGNNNLIPLFVDAVDSGVTLGEISDALRKVFGLYRETVTI